MKPRVVFDCMIFLQAVANENGPAGRCVSEAEKGTVELCVSPETESEVRQTLTRPDVTKKIRSLTAKRVSEFLVRIAALAVVVDPVPSVFELIRDPKDSKYINLALAANAKLIVSRDNDLLELMTGNDDEATRFRTAFPELAILDPVAFLNTIEPAAGGGV